MNNPWGDYGFSSTREDYSILEIAAPFIIGFILLLLFCAKDEKDTHLPKESLVLTTRQAQEEKEESDWFMDSTNILSPLCPLNPTSPFYLMRQK